MVIVKNKLSQDREIMFIGSYMKLYCDFLSQEVILRLENGVEVCFSFKVFDDVYPKKEIKYYENYITSTVIEFLKDAQRNIKTRLLGSVKGDVALLGLEVRDLSFRKRNIPITVDVYIQYDAEHLLENMHLSYDDLRECLVIDFDLDGKSRTLLIGNHQRNLKISWHYNKNIHVKEQGLREHIATIETALNNKLDVLEFYISDNIDHYDRAHLIFPSGNEPLEVLDTNITTFKRVYNYFYNYLSGGIFSSDLYRKIADYYLYGRHFDVKKYSDADKIYLDDVRGKKVNWMSLATEEVLGKSLLHSVLLSNKLVDENHFKEAYNVLRNYADTFYDILNFSMVDTLNRERRFNDQAVLFLRAFHKIFFNVSSSYRSLKVQFYMPQEVEYMDFKDSVRGNIPIPLFSTIRHGNKINITLNFLNPQQKYRYVYVKCITDDGIIEKRKKLDRLPVEEINLWI